MSRAQSEKSVTSRRVVCGPCWPGGYHGQTEAGVGVPGRLVVSPGLVMGAPGHHIGWLQPLTGLWYLPAAQPPLTHRPITPTGRPENIGRMSLTKH